MVYDRINTDVLIVGGGLAGLNTAIAAAECGVQVAVADKGTIERSGDIGGGVDHFTAFLNEGGRWDTRDGFLDYVWRIGKGTTDISIIDSIYCSNMSDAISRMSRIGVPLNQPDGSYYRVGGYGTGEKRVINFNGKKLKPSLAKVVRELGCTVLDKTMILDLVVEDGMVVGATGFNIRSGNFYLIQAKATIVSTGNTNRLYENPRINPFNTWYCPFNTGDGQSMAFRAGAALTNMEYMRLTLLPKGFAAAGLGALVSMGGRLVNSLGEYYMEKNHPEGNSAPRNLLVYYSQKELMEGRGPIFIDCRHLSESDMNHLYMTLGFDKDTLPDYMAQRGEDLRKKLIEIGVSEGLQAGPTEVTGSGIKIDGNCASTVPGLFASGDAADHNRCVIGAVTGGYHAGKAAANYALKMPNVQVNTQKAMEKHAEFVAPLNRKEGITYCEMEDILRKIMTENVGSRRTGAGLETAINKIESLKKYLGLLKANDYHELMRAHETKCILQVAEIMAHAARYRKESRKIPFHYRLDFPETDDENWCGLVVIENKDGELGLSFQRVNYK